jgi:hypothetical protein
LCKEKLSFVSEGVLLGIGLLFGEVFAMKQIKKGAIIQNICPVKQSASFQSNEGNSFQISS